MNDDFQLFQQEFIKRQIQFGLTGYKVYFKHEPIVDCFADIKTDQNKMVATVRLNKEIEQETPSLSHPEESAKHEALHLLTNRLANLAMCRYVTDSEIYEAWEELVRKLEWLIP